MANSQDLFTRRKSLDEVCTIPDKIISVYSLEKHVWDDANAEAARKARKPELRTVQEFQFDAVRPFLNDILRQMAATYRPERKENPIGQGYWIQAEFGSGKSHLLCCLSALALGTQAAWDIVNDKEKKAGRGKRESLYRFWEEGLCDKSQKSKGIFVIVKTLVGAGGGTVGINERGKRLTEYILEAAKEQIQAELGKNLSLYPAELLADRFISEDLDRYHKDLGKFLKDPRFFEEDEFEDVTDFLRDIQENRSPEYKRSAGNKLWRFYTEYLKVQPQIPAETEDILTHLVGTLMAEGYAGLLLVLDEVSLFMKNRDEDQRIDDEKTLVVLSNRLAKIHNLPVWTVCAAQQAIESKMGVKNIIADDRLKLVRLLEDDKDYYDIVLARVREIKDPAAIGNYYLYYKRGFTWPNSIGEEDFRHFFPFHKPALEVLRNITYELTTTRSAIHFMHQTLKHQMKSQGRELIRLWELFDEAVRYEEDPSGTHAGLAAIQTKRESEYRAYEAGKRQIDAVTKGYLKVHRDKAVRTLQTLFLYHVARTRQQGLTPEEIANSILIEKAEDANPDENIQHYETITENLKREVRQIAQSFDEEKHPRYRFDPVVTGVDPREEFRKARAEAESNEVMQQDAWNALLALDEWTVSTRQMTIDLTYGTKSIFHRIAPASIEAVRARELDTIDVVWQGRLVSGSVSMRDLGRVAADSLPLPSVASDQTDRDFSVFIGTKPVGQQVVGRLIAAQKDPRVLFWTPAELSVEERERLLDFAAYRKLVQDWSGKETEDAVAVISWVVQSLQADIGRTAKIVDSSYGRGRIDALRNSQMEFHVAGDIESILSPIVDKVLTAAYESRDIRFEQFLLRKEEAVKVINGIVKMGYIPKGAKPSQDISAAQNFGFGLKIMKKSAERELDVSDNPYVEAIWSFIDHHLADDGQTMDVETLYKNFMGIGGPKDFGLSRRMVQIYLLCLVKLGKVRVTLGPKSGLPVSLIDYANIGQTDFSAKVLDSLEKAQKMVQPENWEVLRPYAAKLLGEAIPQTHDDAVISEYRIRLRRVFADNKDESKRITDKATALAEFLRSSNPYEKEMRQVKSLFDADVEGGNDINLILYALKEAFGYEAFDTGAPSEADVDDLANRLANYTAVGRFVAFDTELRTASAYRDYPFPAIPELEMVRKLQKQVSDKLADLRPYIDSEVRLRTELIGHTPPEAGETGTLGALVHEYTVVYETLHDNVLGAIEQARARILDLVSSQEMSALKILEGISALKPAVSEQVVEELQGLSGTLFTCTNASKASMDQQLKRGPVHECGLGFHNADDHLRASEAAVSRATALLDGTLDRKLSVFLNAAVRERLEQGGSETVIAGLLACSSLPTVRTYLVEAALRDTSLVDTVNHYLKRIIVKPVRISDFTPSIRLLQREQINDLVDEIRKYLEGQLLDIESDDDTLPMLQVE